MALAPAGPIATGGGPSGLYTDDYAASPKSKKAKKPPETRNALQISYVQAQALSEEGSMSVCGSLSLPVGSGSWDGGAARKAIHKWATGPDGEVDVDKAAKAFVCRSGDTLGDLHLPFATVQGGELKIIPAAVEATWGGHGVDALGADAGGAKSFISKLAKKAGLVAPWDRDVKARDWWGQAISLTDTMFRDLTSPTIRQTPGADFGGVRADPVTGKPITTLEIARYGEWDHPNYGPFGFDKGRFSAFIKNFDNNVRRQELPLDIEHGPKNGGENGAAAWFMPGTMRDDNGRLLVDVRWTPKGIALARDEEYKYCSITFKPEWTDPETGVKHKDVVCGAALTTEPFVKGMKSVQDGFTTVNLSEFAVRGGSTTIMATDTKEPYSKGKLEKNDLPDKDDLPGEKGELDGKKGPDGKPGNEKVLSTRKMDDDGGDDSEEMAAKKLAVRKLAEKAEKDKEEAAGLSARKLDETTDGSSGSGANLSGKQTLAEGGADTGQDPEEMCEKMSEMSVDDLAKLDHASAKNLASKLKGPGAPGVRAHLNNASKLMNPVLERMQAKKEESKDMSERGASSGTTTTPTTPAPEPSPHVLELTEMVQNQSVELSETRKELAENRKELAEARKIARKADAKELLQESHIFGERLPMDQEDAVTSLFLALADVDDPKSQTITLAETKTGDGKSKPANLATRFLHVLQSIPKLPQNTTRKAGDPKDDDSGGASQDERILSEVDRRLTAKGKSKRDGAEWLATFSAVREDIKSGTFKL